MKSVMWCMLMRHLDPLTQGLMNICNLARQPQTFQNTTTLITANIRWSCKKTEALTTEPRWFERGVKDSIYIRALHPSLNRDGGRYNLPPVWDNIIKKKVKAGMLRRGGERGLVINISHNVPKKTTGTS